MLLVMLLLQPPDLIRPVCIAAGVKVSIVITPVLLLLRVCNSSRSNPLPAYIFARYPCHPVLVRPG